jgi:Tol biopolymer transport system component
MLHLWSGLILMALSLVGAFAAQPAQSTVGADEIVLTAGNERIPETMGIYVMRADGSNLRQLAHDPDYESMWARISPDRTQIIFHRSEVGKINELNRYRSTSIWLMNADGSDLREIRPAQTDGWFLQGHVEWSPHGDELLVFARETSNSPTQLFLLDLDGDISRRVTTTPGDTADASFSPDGTQIVFAGCPEGGCPSADLYLVPADGSHPARRISDPDEVQDNDPYFSPDGKNVAWNRNRLTRILPPAGESLALVASLAGDKLGAPEQIGDNQLNAVPVWSLDGDGLYVHRFDFDGTKRWDIVWLALATGEMTNLTNRYRTGEMADWTFWFPHAGTPSTYSPTRVGAPPTTLPDQDSGTTPDGPPGKQPAQFAGGFLLLVGFGVLLWRWRRPPS